jgi:universal stress protein E
MKRVERILVATDFSPAGHQALQTAALWARREKAALRIVHVAPPKRWVGGLWGADAATVRHVHQHAAAALQRTAERIDPDRQLELSTGLLSGSASREIARAAREFNADLLVIGARGEHESAFRGEALGDTTTKLVGSTPLPLLVVRTVPPDTPGAVLAAVDLSKGSEHILEWACTSAAGARLFVFHAYDVPFAHRLEAYGLAQGAIEIYTESEHSTRDQQLAALVQAACSGTEIQQIIERGDAATHLMASIQRLEPELVVLGKHKAGARRASGAGSGSGSVCRYAVQFSRCNVLVIPPS